MSNKTRKKDLPDLAVQQGEDVRGGTDSLHLLAELSNLQAQDSSETLKATAPKPKPRPK
jgi:hypothetical protein